MADHFYGISKGAGVDPKGGVGGVGVTADTATTSLAIELRLADGAGLTRYEVLNAIEQLKNYFNDSANTVTV